MSQVSRRFDWKRRMLQHNYQLTRRYNLPVRTKADSYPDCTEFERLLRIAKQSFLVKMAFGRKSPKGGHNDPHWLVGRKFVRIELGTNRERTYPQRLLLWMRHTFPGKHRRKNHYQFFPGKFLGGTGRNPLVSLHRLTLIDCQLWSRQWLMLVIV